MSQIKQDIHNKASILTYRSPFISITNNPMNGSSHPWIRRNGKSRPYTTPFIFRSCSLFRPFPFYSTSSQNTKGSPRRPSPVPHDTGTAILAGPTHCRQFYLGGCFSGTGGTENGTGRSLTVDRNLAGWSRWRQIEVSLGVLKKTNVGFR